MVVHIVNDTSKYVFFCNTIAAYLESCVKNGGFIPPLECNQRWVAVEHSSSDLGDLDVFASSCLVMQVYKQGRM